MSAAGTTFFEIAVTGGLLLSGAYMLARSVAWKERYPRPWRFVDEAFREPFGDVAQLPEGVAAARKTGGGVAASGSGQGMSLTHSEGCK